MLTRWHEQDVSRRDENGLVGRELRGQWLHLRALRQHMPLFWRQRQRTKKSGHEARSLRPIASLRYFWRAPAPPGSDVWGSIVTALEPGGSTTVSTSRSNAAAGDAAAGVAVAHHAGLAGRLFLAGERVAARRGIGLEPAAGVVEHAALLVGLRVARLLQAGGLVLLRLARQAGLDFVLVAARRVDAGGARRRPGRWRPSRRAARPRRTTRGSCARGRNRVRSWWNSLRIL